MKPYLTADSLDSLGSKPELNLTPATNSVLQSPLTLLTRFSHYRGIGLGIMTTDELMQMTRGADWNQA
jgi:hypothetical protein